MINLYDILKVANGQLFGEPVANLFTDFCFDAKQVGENQLYVALRTPRGDTHQYIAEAIDNGVSGVLCVEPPVCDTTGVSVLMVPDTSQALMLWAHETLQKWNTKTIVVVGSISKTTTVAALDHVLGQTVRVLAQEIHEQGRLAIPRTLAHLTSEHDYVILKLSPTVPGEMLQMATIVQPDYVVITHLACEYSAAFTNCSQYFDEYIALLDALSFQSRVIINYDDTYIQEIISHLSMTNALYTVGIERFESDILAFNVNIGLERIGFDLRVNGQRYVGRWSPILGKHHLYSLLIAIKMADLLGIDIESALKSLTTLQPLDGRMAWFDGQQGSILVDDSYAASYSSTDAALEWLRAVKHDDQRTIFVLGDMDQSGMNSRNAHRAIGTSAAHIADIFITMGIQAALSGRAAIDNGADNRHVISTYSNHDVIKVLQNLTLTKNDIVLVKGGQLAGMESVVAALLSHADDHQHLVRQTAYKQLAADPVSLRPSWVEVNLEVIARNMQIIKHHLADDVAVMAVVKADAYGHGAVQTARTVLANGADYLAVASIAEAMELRDVGINAPILILTYAPADMVRQAHQHDLTLTVFDLEQAERYESVARSLTGKLKVHIKIDTGMGRLGILADDAIKTFRHLGVLSNLEIEGIYTHYASADTNDDVTRFQTDLFNQIIRPLNAVGIRVKYLHAANSPAILSHQDYHYNMVRAGGMLYGLEVSEEHPLPDGITPALTWKTRILQVKTLPAGHAVGYGNTYYTQAQETIAIIPVGYADGFSRSPSWEHVLVQGQAAPLVGRVSMEKAAIQVSHIEGLSVGDEVVLLGSQGAARITPEQVAGWLGTINYDVTCRILARIPRR